MEKSRQKEKNKKENWRAERRRVEEQRKKQQKEVAPKILVATEAYKEDLENLRVRGEETIKQVKKTLKLLLLTTKINYPGLRSHKVIIAGKKGEYNSSRVNDDIRLIWRYGKGDEIILVGIGNHDNIHFK